MTVSTLFVAKMHLIWNTFPNVHQHSTWYKLAKCFACKILSNFVSINCLKVIKRVVMGADYILPLKRRASFTRGNLAELYKSCFDCHKKKRKSPLKSSLLGMVTQTVGSWQSCASFLSSSKTSTKSVFLARSCQKEIQILKARRRLWWITFSAVGWFQKTNHQFWASPEWWKFWEKSCTSMKWEILQCATRAKT